MSSTARPDSFAGIAENVGRETRSRHHFFS